MKMSVKRKRGISFLLTAALALSLSYAPLADPAREVYAADYAGHWASDHLSKLSFQNIMRGDENGNFNPDRSITRAEFAAMLNRAFGFERPGGQSFADVDSGAWYASDISYASYQGFLRGTGEGANPTGALTREEAVTMLCRALKIEEIPRGDRLFADNDQFAPWSRGSINAAVEKGVLSGYPDGTFKPRNNISRAEVAKILSTAAGEIVNHATRASLGYVSGNVTLSKTGAGLRDTVITGDLYITEGVWGGYVFLENVTVLGNIIISGSGESHVGASSIVLTNCDINNILIDVGHEKIASLLTQGDTTIGKVTVKSPAYLEESNNRNSANAYRLIELNGPANTKVDLAGGEFREVRVGGINNILNLQRGSVQTLVASESGTGSKIFLERDTVVDELFTDSATTVTGRGKINYLSVGTNGTNIEQMPEEIVIRPGVTAVINGKTMTSRDAELANATPRILNGYPKVEDITVNSASGQIMANKPGTVYWAVKAAGDPEPERDDLKNPKNAQGILQSGNMPLDMANLDDELSAKMTGLRNGGEYDVYTMIVDDRGIESRVADADFMTLDRTAPRFESGYPRGSAESVAREAEGANGAPILYHTYHLEFLVASSKDARLYWLVMEGGQTAPTATQLYSDVGVPERQVNRGDQWLEEKVEPLPIVMRKPGGQSLDENKVYDVYLGLRDRSGNVSGISKVTLRTEDKSPPDFVHPYPQQRQTTVANRIEIDYEITEAGTLYWRMFRQGRVFPPSRPADGTAKTDTGEIISYWDTAEAKTAVKNGSGSVANGTQSVRAERTPQTLAITVPAREITDGIYNFDLYLMLRDASGNESYVGMMEVTRPDTRELTATPWFSTVAERPGEPIRPTVESTVGIQFNRAPYTIGADGVRVSLRTLQEQGRMKELEDRVMLYDATESGPPVPVPIDFENSRIPPMVDGLTILQFPTVGVAAVTGAAIDAAVKLKSGGTYYFELRDFQDEAGNPPFGRSPATGTVILPEFTVREASVEISTAMNGTYRGDGYDFVFDIRPTRESENAAENQLYDTILEVNRNVKLALYELPLDGSLDGAKRINLDSDPTKYREEMNPGRYYMMQDMTSGKGRDSYITTLFRELKATRYGIKILATDDGNIDLVVRGVAGTDGALNTHLLSGSGSSMSAEEAVNGTGPNNFTRNGRFVGYLGPPELSQSIPDPDPPQFGAGYPRIVPAATTARIEVVINKKATMYCLVVPQSGLSQEAMDANEPWDMSEIGSDRIRAFVGATPSKAQLKGGTWGTTTSAGGQHKTLRIGEESVESLETISYDKLVPKPSDLSAEQPWYYVFYLLENENGVESEILYQTFKTIDLEIPRFNTVIADPMEGAVKARVTFHPPPDAYLHYAVWNLGAGAAAAADPMVIVAADPSSVNVHAAGARVVPSGTTGEFDVEGLTPGERYDLYITARHVDADPVRENFQTSRYVEIAPLYNAPLAPSLMQVPFRPDETGPYSGSVTVTFGAQPLYHAPGGQGTQAVPFTRDDLSKLGVPAEWQTVGVTAPLAAVSTLPNNDEAPISSITINYTGAVLGSTITIMRRLTNSGGREGGWELDQPTMGWLRLQLVQNEQGGTQWIWMWV